MEYKNSLDDIKIAFAGDFCPTSHLMGLLEKGKTADDIIGPAATIFRHADFGVVNLEYPLTECNIQVKKYGSHQKGQAESLKVLSDINVKLVNLANNHIRDYTEVGLEDTLMAVSQYGLSSVGADMTLDAAKRPYIVNIKGLEIAFIGVCENEFSVATLNHGGARGLDYSIFRQISELSDQYFVCVLFHGGVEFTHFPRPGIIKLCREFVECGASAVICHHPHFIQGFENYKGSPIVYSLGKFYYSKMAMPDILEVPIATLRISQDRSVDVKFDFFHFSLKTMCLENYTKDEKDRLIERFNDYCDAIQSSERIKREWLNYCQKMEPTYWCCALAINRLVFRILRRLRLLKLIPYFMNFKRKSFLLMQNLYKCESHREIMQTLLGGEDDVDMYQ